MLELGAQNEAVGELIQMGLDEMITRLKNRCRQAIEDEQLSGRFDPVALAAMIIAVNRGAIVLNN